MDNLIAYDLRAEHLHEPMGIDVERPRFGWRLRSDRRGARQTGHHIVVEQLSAGNAEALEVWDSDWTASSDGVDVEYLGPPLETGKRYRWQLRLRDEAGVETDAVDSWFEMGLLRPDDRRARWIHRVTRVDGATDPPSDATPSLATRRLPPADHLRTEFQVRRPFVRARLYATARGVYVAWLNGARVGDHELAPGWTDYRDRIVYQTFDVTDLLNRGANALGIMLGEGWWSGFYGSDRRRQGFHYGELPEAWAQLRIDYADGSSELVVTGEGWTVSGGPILYSDLLMGESYDARRELGAWTEPGFDAAAWQPAEIDDGPLGRLVGIRDEPIRAVERLPAVACTRHGDGWILDFGQNISGRVRFTFRDESSGTIVRMRYAEVLQSDGSLYTENLRTAEATDTFVSAGAGVESYEPSFTSHGFRYAEVTGLAGRLEAGDAEAVVLRNDICWSGSFETSNPDVNQLERNIRWGQRDNFVAVPTDCPQRDERLGWTADVQVFFATAAYNADVQAFFDRWLRDVRFGQTEEGSFPDVAPKITILTEGAPAWGDGGVVIPWKQYQFFGDRRLLEESYASMVRWIDFLELNNPDGIWRRRAGKNYGDWLQVDATTDRHVLATAYFAYSTELVAAAATALRRDDDAARYRALAGRIRAAFRREFVDDNAMVKGDTQTSYLLALAFKLAPDLHDQFAGHLVRTIEEHGGSLTTGFIGVSLLCPVLTSIGRADLAYRLLLRDGYPSWLYSVRQGATTIWERWDGWTKEHGFQSAKMNSFNHYALGSVGEWLYRSVAGIDQAADSTAFRRLEIAPHIETGITWVTADYDTPVGRVRSAWRREKDGYLYEIAVPPGSRARLRLPGKGLREDGAPAAQGAGIEDVREYDGGTELVVQSGNYVFTAE
ncbi:MAG TPA: family 78 glycoside hydrolase catalytic domain [Acidothermaceae bacterium]|jgi:alpha-L-rhamnosidase